VSAQVHPSASRPPVNAVTASSPVVLALRRSEAAKALGVSDEVFDRHVRPSLPVVRLGSVRVYPVEHLRLWLSERAEAPMAELERRAA
jgi:hypothetical protein